MRRQRQRDALATAVIGLDVKKKLLKLSSWLNLAFNFIYIFFLLKLHKSLKHRIGFNLLQLRPLAGSLLGCNFPPRFLSGEEQKGKGVCVAGSVFLSTRSPLSKHLLPISPSRARRDEQQARDETQQMKSSISFIRSFQTVLPPWAGDLR